MLPTAPLVRRVASTSDMLIVFTSHRTLAPAKSPCKSGVLWPLTEDTGMNSTFVQPILTKWHDVDEELAHFNGLCPASTRPSEVFFGCARNSSSRKTSFSPRSWRAA